MVDIDVDHWRNCQELLLVSAKERRRIILIHEDGKVLKLFHSHREPLANRVERVDDPAVTAEQLYRAHSASVDFVAVFERRAFDNYFGRVQAAWSPDKDLDEFVHGAFALMDEYPKGIVTYPGPARRVLGLQWRIGASYEAVKEAVVKFVPPSSTVVFGVFDGDGLWATLVLAFDGDLRVKAVTTVDTAELTRCDGRDALATQVVEWADRTYGPCSVGMFMSVSGAHAFLAASDKGVILKDLRTKGDLIAIRSPASLSLCIGGTGVPGGTA